MASPLCYRYMQSRRPVGSTSNGNVDVIQCHVYCNKFIIYMYDAVQCHDIVHIRRVRLAASVQRHVRNNYYGFNYM